MLTEEEALIVTSRLHQVGGGRGLCATGPNTYRLFMFRKRFLQQVATAGDAKWRMSAPWEGAPSVRQANTRLAHAAPALPAGAAPLHAAPAQGVGGFGAAAEAGAPPAWWEPGLLCATYRRCRPIVGEQDCLLWLCWNGPSLAFGQGADNQHHRHSAAHTDTDMCCTLPRPHAQGGLTLRAPTPHHVPTHPTPTAAVLPSPYQQALFRLMQTELQRSAAGGGGRGSLKGVSNVLMEMRNVCNHPLIRRVGWAGCA